MGARSVPAALVAGIVYFLMPELLSRLFEQPTTYAANHSGVLADILGHIEPSWAAGFSFILFVLSHRLLQAPRGRDRDPRRPTGVVLRPAAGDDDGGGCGGRGMSSHLLDVIDVTKHYAGVAALIDVSMHVDAGEFVGLLGAERRREDHAVRLPDRPTATHLREGEPRWEGPPQRALCLRRGPLGVARTFQRMELFSGSTVREHALVGYRAHHGGRASFAMPSPGSAPMPPSGHAATRSSSSSGCRAMRTDRSTR